MNDCVALAEHYRAEALRLRVAAQRGAPYAVQSALICAVATYEVMAAAIEADARMREAIARDRAVLRARWP